MWENVEESRYMKGEMGSMWENIGESRNIKKRGMG